MATEINELEKWVVRRGECLRNLRGIYFKATVSLLELAVSEEFLNIVKHSAEPSLQPVP